MVDSEYSTNICKSLNIISIETVMRNPEMLKFVPDHLKTEKVCKHAVKKLSFLVRYVPDQDKTQQMCDKAILENGGTLKSTDCFKHEETCDKAVDNYPQALEFVPECYKTQKMCDKATDTHPFINEYILECFRAVNRCFLYFILFLIGITRKKCVTELFLKIFF